MTPITESSMETGQSSEITDLQKMDLFEETINSLENKVLALIGDNKANRAAIKDILSLNIGSLIEEICSGNPKDGIAKCNKFFSELIALFGGEDPEKLDQAGKSKIFNKLAHVINLKLSPLMIKKLEKVSDGETVENFKEDFEGDKKQFIGTGIGNFVAVFDEAIPTWYNDINLRMADKKMRIDAIHDPEAAKLQKDIHDRAMRELRGEE